MKSVQIPDFTPRNEEPADANLCIRVPKSLRARLDGVKQHIRAREVNRYLNTVLEAATNALEETLRAS